MDKDNFGDLICSALRDEAAGCRLPEDFADRVLRSVKISQSGGCENLRFPRWTKVAAAIVAMASFASFAAWVGVVVYETVRESSEVVAKPTDAETEVISNQGENTMIARKMATVVGASVLSVAVGATELTSEPTFVFLRPETSSFWHTATGNEMTVPIDYPAGATSATLEVRGIGYSASYGNLTKDKDDSFTFTLPAAESPQTENVYELKLMFNDGTERTAKLGLIQGLSPDAEGTTRCLAPSGSKVWNKVNGQAVLPIPYGMTSFKVNGVETDTGLKGEQGWYALGKINPNEPVSVSLTAYGKDYMASLLGGGAGLMLIFR